MTRPILLVGVIVVAGCARTPPPSTPSPSDEKVARAAKAALAPFKAALKQALDGALAVSPDDAVDVCAERAPELARAASHGGVTVGRSAARLRNANNAPRLWLAPLFDELAKAPSGSDASRVVSLPGGGHGYAEAIWTGDKCLMCHGDAIAPALEARLSARYPDDKARGFQKGDLRGVFWAELEPGVPVAPR